ncbi:MAG TPA: molybdopterin-dependent oxidoreductase, partial [Salinivirgaceae bacterium]|nr:molybdopterin-dependent oxidoreductase [Salinivirgaceae bacterium]
MTEFVLNGRKVSYTGDSEKTLLEYLREDCHLTAAKDGCSGEGICGACTVEIDGKAKLACKTKMKQLNGAQVQTLEGIPEDIINIIATIFVNNGAVQCGFCTPGFVSRTKILLQENPNPTIEEIRQAIKPHLCRCTGYKKIERAIAEVATTLSSKQSVKLDRTQSGVGKSAPKYEALEAAKGTKKYTDDLFFPGMKYAALLFSEYPKAKVRSIDTREAKNAPGVIRVFTASDIPGDKIIGLIRKDQYVMISEGESTHYIGDVIAAVVADSEALARQAVKKIKVDYEPLEPVTDVFKAIDGALVHDNTPNLISTTSFKVGFPDAAFQNAAFIARGRFETQRVEHAFLEKECAVAHPDSDGGVTVYSQGQGVYVDQKQIAAIISLPLEKVRVKLLSNGGGFGGKEDLSVQGFAAWFAHALQLPVKVRLTRQESIRMHPKRHPVFMDMELAADKTGKLTALRLRAVGDTGAYASVGEKVMERVAGHATAGYF